jgi:predicted dehydrogenase
MALYLTPEKKEEGQKNFTDAVVSRRGFLKGFVAAAGTAGIVTPAVYFGYKAWEGKPVKVGLIGAGDEGGVLVGEHPWEYLEFIAYSDIRPYNKERIFKGERTGPRKGFNAIYGKDAEKNIAYYEDYKKLLDNKDIEAVVIALPLHLHAPVAIDAMRAGKHVLCEKLMAWNITQCKKMIEVAQQTNRILTIGHQRHYSLLYAHGVELLASDKEAKDEERVVGDIRHIRAQWHRNNSWPYVAPNDPTAEKLATGVPQQKIRDGWFAPIYERDFAALAQDVKKYGYKNMQELVRWRLFDRTGGGLMAELGSHQLDACSIFLGKVHPLAVQGVGGRFFYREDQEPGREADDGVFVTFEFPGANYYEKSNDGKPTSKVKDKDDIVVVTYSSVNTSNFGGWGEWILGSRGSLVVEKEESIMLFPENNPNPKVSNKPTGQTVTTAGGGKPAVESSGTGGPTAPVAVPGATAGPVSKGYTEEMAHFAHCVRMHQKAEKANDKAEMEKWRLTPRCHGKVAMADAIIALTSNLAMRQHQRIEFKEAWFDPTSTEVPDPKAVALDADGKPVTL